MENFALNEWALNSWSNDLVIDWWIQSWIAIWWFQLCGESSWVTMQYNDRTYSNKFYENQYIDGQRLISHLIKEKRISMKFFLRADSNAELQTLIDDFKTATSWQLTWWVIPLVIFVNGEQRELKVIVSETKFNEDWITTNVQTWTMEITAVDPPRFYTKIPTLKYYQNVSANFSWQINNNWNAITYPVYYFVFNSAVWVTNMSWSINWYAVNITTPIVSWDIIVISSDIYWIIANADVFKNWIAIDYMWQLTTPLNTWSNGVQFTCDWVYDVDITVLYNKMWE